MIQPIPGLPQTTVGASSATAAAKEGATGPDFLNTLRSAVEQVSQLQSEADAKVGGMFTGDGQDVHSTMIAVEKADLAFELMVQVRNKIVSAYQEISRIPF
jgi:flagellar hook-basal body complex protein FliE